MKNIEENNKALNKTLVNSSYFDKEGNEIILGDILFYSEYDGKNNDLHYADGIYLIIESDGELAAKCKVLTMTNAKEFIDYDEPKHNMLMLHEYCDGNQSNEFTKIGNIKENSYMLFSDYANKTYSIL